MLCQFCREECRRFGKNRNGSQRFRCDACVKTFTDETTRPQDRRKLDNDQLILCLRMLLEGNSLRSVSRLTGVARNTIMYAMVEAGANCKRFLETTIKRIDVEDVQADE